MKINRGTMGSLSMWLCLAGLLFFSCKTPTDPEPSIFPLMAETGPVKMLVLKNESGLSTYNLLTGEEQLFLEPGLVPNPEPGNSPYFRNAIGSAIWHPDGKSVVYEESYGLDIQHLQSIDMLTGKFLFGLGRGGSNAYLGDISGDGKTLVFGNSIYGPDGNHEIFSMSMDDLIRTQLTYRPGDRDRYPTLHPNGYDLIFESRPHWIDSTTPNYGEIGAQLYHMTLDGGSITKIELEGYANSMPNFNPKSDEIVYVHNDEHHIFNSIWKATDMTFSEVVQLTDSSSLIYIYPRWSNDGSKIVYALLRGQYARFGEIWMMNADGSGKEMLVSNGRYGSLYIRE